jgi:hypothetical protein
MAVYSIDFERLAVYEAGALLVTLLAYPGESEDQQSKVHVPFAPTLSGQNVRLTPIGLPRRNR